LQTIYFSERLLCQLERLHTVPLTLVEAPAGYGKTTALKHALRDVPYGALRWHNAQDATVCCDWLARLHRRTLLWHSRFSIYIMKTGLLCMQSLRRNPRFI